MVFPLLWTKRFFQKHNQTVGFVRLPSHPTIYILIMKLRFKIVSWSVCGDT